MVTSTFVRLFLATLFLIPGAVVLEGCKTMPPTPTVVLQRDGDHAFEWGRYEEAASYYRQIVDREPGNADAQTMYGRCLMALGQPGQAADAFAIALARRPGDRDLVLLLSQARFDAGQTDRAFEIVRVWALDNADAGAWTQLARFAMRSGDPDTARQAVLRAIETDPTGSAAPYLVAADLEESLGNTAEALRRLRQAHGIELRDDAILDRLRAYGEVPGPTLVLPPGV